MTESNHTDGASASKERALDHLIRGALERPSDAFERPTDEAITAYLLGVADREQQDQVQSALVSSPEFRAEMLEAARDLERLDSETVQAEFDKAAAPAAPRLSELLGEQPPAARPAARQPARAAASPDRSNPGILDAIRDFLRPPRLLPMAAAAAAATVAFMLLSPPRHRPPFQVPGMKVGTTKWDLASELFTPVTVRSGAGEEDIVEETVQDAAVASFQRVIAYEGRRFLIQPPASAPAESGRRKYVVLRVSDPEGRELGRLTAAIPESAIEVTAVAILLHTPSPRTYTMSMTSDSLDARWTGAVPDSGAVTFVYGIDRRFGASRAVPFRFRKN